MKIVATTTSQSVVVELSAEEMAALLGKTSLDATTRAQLVQGTEVSILPTLQGLRNILRRSSALADLVVKLRGAATLVEEGIAATPEITREG